MKDGLSIGDLLKLEVGPPSGRVAWARQKLQRILAIFLEGASPDNVEELQGVLDDDMDSDESTAIVTDIAICDSHQPPRPRCRWLGSSVKAGGSRGRAAVMRSLLLRSSSTPRRTRRGAKSPQ